MGVIKINDVVYGSNNSADIIYKDITVEEKLDNIPIFDPSDNTNIEDAKYDYLTYAHIVDNLTSNDSNKILSANQGKVLKSSIDTLESNLTNAIADVRTDTENFIYNDLINIIYPIGSIYMSVNNVSPASFLGGTWEAIQDRFLLSAGSSYSAGNTGGAATHNHNISPGKAWATIGNYSETICFGAGMGSQKWKDWTASTPYYWTHNADTQLTSDQSRYESGTWTNVYGNTDVDNNMPPYLTVYMWKRVS